MNRLLKISLFYAALFLTHLSFAQTAKFPIVKGFGGIYEVKNATEMPDPNQEYKIIIDMTTEADNPTEISRWVDNIARIMNLHGLAGVPKEKIHVKVVIHGEAILTLLDNEGFQMRKRRYQTDNPNLEVYKAVKEAGAEIYVCGQSMIARGFNKDDLWSEAIIAHSALTTFTTYVPQGYVLIKF